MSETNTDTVVQNVYFCLFVRTLKKHEHTHFYELLRVIIRIARILKYLMVSGHKRDIQAQIVLGLTQINSIFHYLWVSKQFISKILKINLNNFSYNQTKKDVKIKCGK